MTAVNFKATFGKNERSHNGLESIAGRLVKDPFTPVLVVGIVRPYRLGAKVGEELAPTVEWVAVEPVGEADATAVRDILDRAARARGVPVPDPLPIDAGE